MSTEIIVPDNEPLTLIQRELLKMALSNGWDISFSPNYESENDETVIILNNEVMK